jgi:hypothetical protein
MRSNVTLVFLQNSYVFMHSTTILTKFNRVQSFVSKLKSSKFLCFPFIPEEALVGEMRWDDRTQFIWCFVHGHRNGAIPN